MQAVYASNAVQTMRIHEIEKACDYCRMDGQRRFTGEAALDLDMNE